jgi:hypothetical protein
VGIKGRARWPSSHYLHRLLLMTSRMRQVALAAMVCLGVLGGPAFAHTEPSTYALVGQGGIGRYKWASWVERSETRKPQRDVTCISIATEEPSPRGGESGETYECSRVSPGVPVIQAVSNDAPGRKRRTVIVIIFDPSARRMVLNLGALGRRSVKLRRVSDSKARQVGIKPAAYWSHAFAGIICMGRLAVYDRSGGLISDTGPTLCRAP